MANVRYVLPMALVDRYRDYVRDVSNAYSAVAMAEISVAQPRTRTELLAIVENVLRSGDSEMSEVDRQYYVAARRYITGDMHWSRNLAVDDEWMEGFERAIDAIIVQHGAYDPETGMFEIEDMEGFETDLTQFIVRSLNDSSKHYVHVYGNQDYLKPRFARVPSGAETCAWCYALAGLGFQYKSAESASHSHAGCDCAIVPSWDESYVDGYDPEEYADMFRGARTWLNSGDAPTELVDRVHRNAVEHTSGRYQSIRNYERWNGVLAAMRQMYGLK